MHPIERARRAKGWTQADLASQLGVHVNTVQGWEKGAQPRTRLLPRIAEILGVSAGELLDQLVSWTPSRVLPPHQDATTDARDSR